MKVSSILNKLLTGTAFRATLASTRPFIEALRSLEHHVGVSRGLRDRLDHVPVLDDLAAFQAEDVHHRLPAGIIGQAVPMTVKNNVIAVSKDTLDLAAGTREPCNDLPQAFHAVFDQRIVLAIAGGDSVKPEGIFDPAFGHSFVEGYGDVFVGLGHGLSP